MELRQLRFFLAVSEYLQYGRAAARFNVAQPWVTCVIQVLKCELGTGFLDRDKRRVELTPSAAPWGLSASVFRVLTGDRATCSVRPLAAAWRVRFVGPRMLDREPVPAAASCWSWRKAHSGVWAATVLRRAVIAGHAGRRRATPGWRGRIPRPGHGQPCATGITREAAQNAAGFLKCLTRPYRLMIVCAPSRLWKIRWPLSGAATRKQTGSRPKQRSYQRIRKSHCTTGPILASVPLIAVRWST